MRKLFFCGGGVRWEDAHRVNSCVIRDADGCWIWWGM